MPNRDPALEAQKIRLSTWGNVFPVDPVQIAQMLGVNVREAILRDDISGALVKKLGQDPTILLNASDHPNRKRFTAAHELGHFITREKAPDAYEYVDLRDTIWSAAGRNPEEVFANQFAANLLMPESEIQRLIDKGMTPTQMAAYFKVSQDAMANRLKNVRAYASST